MTSNESEVSGQEQSTSIVIVYSDNWMGLYVNGKNVAQCHNIWVTFLHYMRGMSGKRFTILHEECQAAEEAIEDMGQFPMSLKELRRLYV